MIGSNPPAAQGHGFIEQGRPEAARGDDQRVLRQIDQAHRVAGGHARGGQRHDQRLFLKRIDPQAGAVDRGRADERSVERARPQRGDQPLRIVLAQAQFDFGKLAAECTDRVGHAVIEGRRAGKAHAQRPGFALGGALGVAHGRRDQVGDGAMRSRRTLPAMVSSAPCGMR
jgi:hypothetical protein